MQSNRKLKEIVFLFNFSIENYVLVFQTKVLFVNFSFIVVRLKNQEKNRDKLFDVLNNIAH